MQSLMEFWSIEKQRLIDRDVVQLWHHSIESTAFPISEVELCDARIQGTPLKDYYKVTILQSDHYNLWMVVQIPKYPRYEKKVSSSFPRSSPMNFDIPLWLKSHNRFEFLCRTLWGYRQSDTGSLEGSECHYVTATLRCNAASPRQLRNCIFPRWKKLDRSLLVADNTELKLGFGGHNTTICSTYSTINRILMSSF